MPNIKQIINRVVVRQQKPVTKRTAFNRKQSVKNTQTSRRPKFYLVSIKFRSSKRCTRVCISFNQLYGPQMSPFIYSEQIFHYDVINFYNFSTTNFLSPNANETVSKYKQKVFINKFIFANKTPPTSERSAKSHLSNYFFSQWTFIAKFIVVLSKAGIGYKIYTSELDWLSIGQSC